MCLVINMQSPTIECCVCGAEDQHRWALATYEDVILPDDWAGEWMGNACCKTCWLAWKAGVIEPHMTFARARAAIAAE